MSDYKKNAYPLSTSRVHVFNLSVMDLRKLLTNPISTIIPVFIQPVNHFIKFDNVNIHQKMGILGKIHCY